MRSKLRLFSSSYGYLEVWRAISWPFGGVKNPFFLISSFGKGPSINDVGNWEGDGEGSKIGQNCRRIVPRNYRHWRRGLSKIRKNCRRHLWMVSNVQRPRIKLPILKRWGGSRGNSFKHPSQSVHLRLNFQVRYLMYYTHIEKLILCMGGYKNWAYFQG